MTKELKEAIIENDVATISKIVKEEQLSLNDTIWEFNCISNKDTIELMKLMLEVADNILGMSYEKDKKTGLKLKKNWIEIADRIDKYRVDNNIMVCGDSEELLELGISDNKIYTDWDIEETDLEGDVIIYDSSFEMDSITIPRECLDEV